jgi:hypothetical protein
MPGTVVGLEMLEVSLCNAIGSWTGSPSPALNDPDLFGQKEGANCLQSYQAAGGARSADWTWTTNQDFGGKIIYMWFAISRITGIPVKGSTGMRIRVEDVSANWAEWDIFGSDTLPHGGWICWAVEFNSATASRTGGTFPIYNQIRKVGWRCGGTVLGKVYLYWDAVRVGKGLQIYGGTSGDKAKFDDFVTSENTNAWGVVNKFKGVYFIQGKLYFGAVSGSTYFQDTLKSLRFQDNLVTGAFYELKTIGNTGADTEVYFGDAGISGCDFGLELATQTARYLVDLSASDRTKIGIYGCSFKRSGTITLPVYNASYMREVLNTTFENCGAIYTSTCVIENCSFISAVDAGFRITSESHKLKDCKLISCPYGVRFPNTGSYGLSNVRFSGTFTAHIDNISGGQVIINRSNLTDCTTFTGDTVMKDSIDLTIIVKTESGTPIFEALAYIDDDDLEDPPPIMNTLTDINGVATVNYNGSPMTNSRWRVRKYGYKNFKQLINTGSVNIDLPVTLVVDPQQT